jgi:hypothetical protein
VSGFGALQDSSLTAISATMYLSGPGLWPFNSTKQQILTDALYQDIGVSPIDIRITSFSLQDDSSNSRRRRRLLQQQVRARS